MKTKATKRLLALALTLVMLLPNLAGAVLDAKADSGYTTGTATVYDVYDLTGTTAKQVNAWALTEIGSFAAETKEQAALQFKMNITNERHRYRFAVGNTAAGNVWDPHGYAVEIAVAFDNGQNHVKFTRGGSQIAQIDDVSRLIGEHVYEFGYRNLISGGAIVGKQVYLSVDGVIQYSYEDVSGYLTGDALGNLVTMNHIDSAAVSLNSAYENSYADVTVYDVYDLTGKTNNAVDGTGNGNWSPVVLGNINAADKESVSFKANVKFADDAKYRFSLSALDGVDLYDPAGYGFELAIGSESRVVFVRGSSHTWIKAWSVDTSHLKGEYELEFGYQDISFGGQTIGKRIFLKKNGEVLYSYDDMDGYLTGDNLGTKVALFHYGTAVQMNTTYENNYGEANVYDIYDLTGAASNSIKGTNDTWDGQIHATIPAEHKENFAFKTKMTMGTQNVRMSLSAKDGDSIYDPTNYALYLYGESGRVELRRNNATLTDAYLDTLAGTYIFEVGIVDILFAGQRVGKHLYVKMNDVIVCEYDDVDGYLTGDALGSKIIDFHYGAAIQMDTTYESGYGEVNVYEISDLTGADANTINGTGNGNWSATVFGNIDAAHKENVSLKANVKITDEAKYRFSLSALESDDCVDPAGYGFELNLGTSGYVAFMRGSSHTWIASWGGDTTNLKGTYQLEFGYRDILFGNKVTGKQIFLKKDGEVIYSFDDVNGYLTGNALGTKAALFHYGSAIQMNNTSTPIECSHNYDVVTTDPDCVNAGKTVYTCTLCGNSYEETIDALGHSYVANTTPADCNNDGKTVYTCSVCGDSYEEVIPAAHALEYVAAVVPANCQETGHDEYWYCAACDCYFGSEDASYQINPAWINYTGEHVRPEGSAICAVVPCEICGEDSYGEACDNGDAPDCQDAPCVHCGETVYGWGCTYDVLCQPGDCIYCGQHYEKLAECENGSWAPCTYDGECVYGCGKQFPATGEHALDNPCEGDLCWLCWENIEGVGHKYESVVTAPTATKEGYTTHTCSVCGDSYVDSTVPAIGIDELKFTAVSVALKSNLNISFSVPANQFIEDAYSAPYAVFQVGIKTQTVTDYKIVDDKYVFTCTNLAPSQLGDTVYATLYATLDDQLCSYALEYSIAQYCYSMLEETEDAKLRTLLVDLLNYGAAAQTYAWYKDKTLCNADLTDAQKAWGTQNAPEMSSKLNTKAAVVDNAKATWKAVGLVLDNAVTMRFRFAAESVEGLSVKIVNGDQEWIVSEFTAAEQDGQYYAFFSGLSARQMRDVVSVTVYEGDTAISNTLEYSVESYAYSKQNEARLGDLVKAMITYGDSAAAYLN